MLTERTDTPPYAPAGAIYPLPRPCSFSSGQLTPAEPRVAKKITGRGKCRLTRVQPLSGGGVVCHSEATHDHPRPAPTI